MIEIRPATAVDIPAIARVLVDTWRATFAGRLPKDFLDGLSYSQQEERHRRGMSASDRMYFVASVAANGAIAGFACAGPCRDKEFSFSSELYAIYVRPEFQRAGAGTALFRAVTENLMRAAKSDLLVWVLADNPCRPFYARQGGCEIAERPIALGSATVVEIAYAWHDLRSTI